MSDNDWTGDFAGISTPAPSWNPKRPLRIAILGDFGGGALRGRLDKGAALAKRKPLKVEFDTLEDALARLDLKLTLPIGADGAPVEVEISELESFHPDELYRNVEVFSALASLRKRLNNSSTFAAAAAEVQAMGGKSGEDSWQTASSVSRHGRARGGAPAGSAKLDDFARLTGRASVGSQADDSIAALLKRIVGPFVKAAAAPNKDALIATVDAALTDAMRAVLMQGDFQNAEALWRGVDFLLRRVETSHQLQVHLIDISAEELAADLSAVDDLSESGLYKLLVETPSQDADGGYSYIAGLYQFEATPPHAELLGRAARVAAHAGAPFITQIAPDVFTDRKEPPHRLIQQAFRALKELPDASYLALMAPSFLLRHPYGKKSDPIQSFAFEEFSRSSGLRGMLWGHPALLALSVLATPGAQLTIGDLAFHYYVDEDGDSIALPCTNRLVNTNASSLLREWGINGVMAHKGEALVRLAGLEAVNDDGLAAGNAPRKKPSDSRGSIGSKPATGKPAVDWAPAQRGAGTVGVSMTTKAAAPAPAAAAPAPAAAAAEPEEAAAVSADDELDALLASLGDPPEPAAAAPAAADEPAAAPAEAAADPDMDPDLEALLASLG
ncbi:type VI secretion system contractile sheath large subunit [Paucibacter sp. R3-3]|uniref:Type VI secretion system contractile sheath large subunit n=1 Tax=Roseateles agri TaxID=3098619 RepID=A0ABU5DI71_9BURK|nr:type VI secretion system contractile sheath large subunit [Paucibacter sp. R3-3]MDY0745988.1 type VI secretion system contractile sheath large subunit [Paucibacter sp. R3-3]